MHVLLTGGAGFIGSHLSDVLLTRGDDVAVIDDLSTGRASRLDNRVSLYKETILDAPRLTLLVRKIQPSLIFHLAAQVDVRKSVASPTRDADVNVVGTINVLEAARTIDARVIFCSTSALYGKLAPIPSPESTVAAPESPYGTAKYCAELYVGLYNRLYGTRHSILRLANVYGPRQKPINESGVVPALCSRAIAGEKVTIYGDGRQTRDWVYVTDVVAAILAAADYGHEGTWNIGTGKEASILGLIQVIERIAGCRSVIDFAPPREGDMERSAVCPNLAKRDLGWWSTVPLAKGVEAVINWIASGASDRALA